MKKPRRQRKKPTPTFQTFILEPILTPSGLVDAPGDDTPDPSLLTGLFNDLDGDDLTDTPDDFDSDFPEELTPVSFFDSEPPESPFNAGVFTVADSGQVGIDFLYDGGGYKGELAIFSLEGMEVFEPGSEEFIEEAARRALTNSTEGHIVIQDATEGAKFEGKMSWESNFNSGEYKGVKTVEMNPGETFGVMLVPRGTVQQVYDNPDIGGATRPLFSMETINPNEAFHVGQIADVTGDGNTFVMEDLRVDGFTDEDYNDIIFQVRGATAEASLIDEVIDADRDWRFNDTGKALIEYAQAYVEPPSEAFEVADVPTTNQPLVGVIDTGFAENNPDLDYSNITLGRDWVDRDNNPLLTEGEGNEHGTHILGLIAAQRDNDIGVDGINPDAPLWVGRAVGSGEWANSLTEFVDAAIESGQPNAVVNLSMDLTQVDAEDNITTRYEFTPMEREAIEYARQNNVMLVVAAGNDGGVMSALGQASQEFDNIMTVGAAEQFDPDTSAWKGADRTNYSSYGQSLDVVAYGGTTENPQLSLAGEGTSGMAGTSVATAKVTGAVSQVWAANPELSYRQVVEIIRDTATDLGDTGNDAETGAGLLNLTAAVHLAKVTKPKEHSTPALLSPETWSGEGVFTPGERAVQSVNVPPKHRRQYFGWLDSSNPADTFSFQLDKANRFASSLDFPGNLVLRRNGKVIEEGSFEPDASSAPRFMDAGTLEPGNYTLTVDRGSYSKIDQYSLIMNFLEGSVGKEKPVIEWLPAKPVVQPQPTPTPTPTPSPSPEELAAKKRAADKVRAVYEANRQRLGNSRRDIQIFEQAFDGVNMPAVQYFDGGYIIWNGQKAIPYFTGTGNALPDDIDLPSTVKPIWDVVPFSNVTKVPDGRHTYPNMRGSSEYWVDLDGNKNDISLAVRDTVLAHPDLRTTVYRDLGNGRLQQVPLTDINPDDNYINYQDLPAGKYLIKVDVEQSKANLPYEMVVNLDQAGNSGIEAWNINRESVNGQIAGQRIIVSDHVGLPSGDRDLYVFTTDDMETLLQFAVRSQDSDGSEADRQRPLDGDVRVRILDEGGKQIGNPVDSESREPIYGVQWLEPNSKYYVEVTALNGTKTNYDVVLNFDKLKADGRYEFTDLRGEFDYEFSVDGTNRQLYTAIRGNKGSNIPAAYYNSQLYRSVNGQWSKVTPNSTGNAVLRYDSLPQGHYRMEIEPKRFLPGFMRNMPYKFVHNLDQAGGRREDARDLGNIAGWGDDKRTVVKDHVGIPDKELDFYKFKTDNHARVLQLAVRTGHDGTDAGPLDGNLRMRLLDKNGKIVQPKSVVSGKDSGGVIRSHYLKETPWASYDLEPNSEYSVKIEPSEEVDATNYYLVVNAKEKRTVKPPGNVVTNPNPNYIYKESDYLNTLYQDGTGNRISSRRNDGYHNTGRAFDSVGGQANSKVYALVGGEVIEAKNGKEFGNFADWQWGYNGTVAIYNKELNKTFIYWHLAEGSINESLQGKTIAPGTLIGREGNTGYSTGIHTHVEVHNGRANVNMSNPSRPRSPANFGRLHIPTIFQDAVRKGLVKLYR